MLYDHLYDLILPWLDIPTLMSLRQTCREMHDAIQKGAIQTFESPMIFVRSTYEKEANAFRSGYLTMDSWKCICGRTNVLRYEMSEPGLSLVELLQNTCKHCGAGLKLRRLFVGQLKRNHTLPSLLWTIRMLCPEVQVITVENRVDQKTQRNKGCCWVTVIDWTADILLAYHRRIFFDILPHLDRQISGFWVVSNHQACKEYLEHVAFSKRTAKCRSLPRKPVVVELANLQLTCSKDLSGPSPATSMWQGFTPSFQRSFERVLKLTENIAKCSPNHTHEPQLHYETTCISDFALTPRGKGSDGSILSRHIRASPPRTISRERLVREAKENFLGTGNPS